MWLHFLNLLWRSFGASLSAMGTTVLGWCLGILLPAGTALGMYLTERNKPGKRSKSRKALKPILVGFVIALGVYFVIFGWQITRIIFQDHEQMKAKIVTLEPLEKEALGHCLSAQQKLSLEEALKENPSRQGYSTSSVYIAYRGIHPPGVPLALIDDPNTGYYSKCTADLLEAFISAHWEPVLRSVTSESEVKHTGIVFAYFTDKPLPQYDPLKAAFTKAEVPFSEVFLNFRFNEQYTSLPSQVIPVIYVAEEPRH